LSNTIKSASFPTSKVPNSSPTQYNNLTFATGHAMMGWSLGPATGKLVTEIISDQKPSLDLNPFHVQRTF